MHEAHLREALRLAAKGRYRTASNPVVGALVTDVDDAIIGRGYHRRLGGPHAEVEALSQAGRRAAGGTLYVTLEPCSHHGRTPPCSRAVIGSGVRKVVACHRDPNPLVMGRGFAALRKAGIVVEVGDLALEAVELNSSFVISVLTGRPSITLKWAMSMDGKIATASGESQWISSPAGRRWALDLRETHDAILVGSGTIVADDPSLNRRLKKADGPILRVVVDRRLRTPAAAKLFELEGPVLIFTESSAARRIEALESAGATVVVQRTTTLDGVMRELAARAVQSVLVEGGGEMLGAFAGAGLFDRVEVCCAPLLIGGSKAPGPLGGAGIEELASAARLDRARLRRRGSDLILSGYRRGLLEELAAALTD